ALVELGVGRITRDAGAVRIGQLYLDAIGDPAVGGCAADIKAAQFPFTAGVDAVVGRSDIATEALDIRQLRTHAENIAPVGRGREVVHGGKFLVGHGRCEVADVAADASNLEGGGEFLTRARAQGVVDGVVNVGERCRAIDDARQWVRALTTGPEADG